ncbi:50S ribosomal protein L17 [bacterium]|nr:50S ribosomal protein L17 [bacterium]
MRHRNRRGKLGRKSEHRMMMLRNMATSLFERERIQTTMPKAKQLRPFAEKLITLARKQDVHARRLMQRQITNRAVLKKLFDEIAKRYKEDNKGGYTRIVAYRTRWGDGAQLAFIELTNAAIYEKKAAEDSKKKKKASKKAAAEEEGGKQAKADNKDKRKPQKPKDQA